MSSFEHPSNTRNRAAAIVATAVAAALLAGCGGSGSNTTTTTTTAKVSPADLSRAADVSSAASGYRAVMTVSESVPGIGALSLNGNGSFAKQQGQMTIAIKLPSALALVLGGQLQMAMVIHNGILYMKLPQALTSKVPGTKPWIEIDLRHSASGSGGLSSLMSSSRQLSDPGQYFQWLHAIAGTGLQNLGSATVNGVQTTHYHANVSLAQLMHASSAAGQPMVAQAEQQLSKQISGGTVPIDAYIDSSNLVRRVVIKESLSLAGKTSTSLITVDFPQYGPQAAPTVPPSSQVTNFKTLGNIP